MNLIKNVFQSKNYSETDIGVTMPPCKKCQSTVVVKNGFVRNHQRYYCKNCKYNFIEGDARINSSLPVKKALAVILYSVGKASFRLLGRIFNVSPSLVYNWIVEEAEKLPEPEVSNTIREMEFDEMWHFIGQKKTSVGSSKPWIVLQGELWHGCWGIVALQPLNDYMRK